MHTKIAYASAVDDPGLEFSIIDPTDGVKTASFLPEVARFFERLQPDPAYLYAHTNAMGRSEYYGSNANSDWYGYNEHLDFDGLMHVPEDFGIDPARDLIRCKDWAYGYPSFYNATVYANHKNTDPKTLGFGDVVFATHNPGMKRIELVQRISKAEARAKGKMYLIDKIRRGDKVDVSMGCFRAGALITMADGTRKPIEDIEAGDLVRTHLGRTRKVTETHRRQYTGAMYEIRPEGEGSFHATRQHPFWAHAHDSLRNIHGVWRKEELSAPEWIHAECLEGHFLSAPLVDTEGASVGLRAEEARLIGYYLAAGHLVRNKKKQLVGVQFTVNVDDVGREEIPALCEALGSANEALETDHPVSEQARFITVNDRSLAEMCQRWAGSGAKTKRLAPEIFSLHRENALQLLGAYANGAGHGPKDGSLKFSTAASGLAYQVRDLLRQHDMQASVNSLNHGPSAIVQKSTVEWVVHVGKQWAPTLAAYTPKVCASKVLKAKNPVKRFGAGYAVPIRSTESYEGTFEVFNFEVEEDESYVVNGVSAHNCKVPFDACSICTDWETVRKARAMYDPLKMKHWGIAVLLYHHKVAPIRGIAPAPKDWCQCMRAGRNTVLPSGQKVFVYNDLPRFFDISCVWVGADRTACVMYHLDTPDSSMPEDAPFTPQKTDPVMDALQLLGLRMKVAAEEETSKEIPGGFTDQVLGCDANSDITPAVSAMQKNLPLRTILSSLAAKGILLRPREFQNAALTAMDEDPDDKQYAGKIFSSDSNEVDDSLAIQPGVSRLSGLLDMLAPMRSSHQGHLRVRVLRAPHKVAYTLPELTEAADPVLDKVAALYNGYRLSALEKADEILDPSQVGADLTVKSAGVGTLLAAAATAPMIHWMASNLREKQRQGEDLGMMSSFVASAPTVTSVLLIGAALRAQMALQKSGAASGQDGAPPQGLRGALKNMMNNAANAL